MEIVKYKKLKNYKYQVVFSNNETVDLYDDIILKYNLLRKKEITKDELKTIINDNTSLEAFMDGVNYFNKKLRSKKEVFNYLTKKEYSKDDVNKAIKLLEERNIINDDFVCKCFINDQINFNLRGPYKIKDELIKLGISDDIIAANLDFNDPRYEENIKKIINKKIKANHKYSKNMLINRIKNDLYNMGYQNYDHLVNSIKIDDQDFLQKEYQKLLIKYQNKDNKEYLIKQKLYQKGYSSDDINKLI